MTTLSDRNTPLNTFGNINHNLPIKGVLTMIPSGVQIGTLAQPTDLNATLAQRGSSYGKFTGQAKLSQDLKQIMHNTMNWTTLAPDQKESLNMIVHKIARILNGVSTYPDSWVDIAGYAKLVGDRLLTGSEA